MRKRFDYALILVGRLKDSGKAFMDIGYIAKDVGLPRAYLEKVAQELRRAGWLESRKGAGGGYRLLKNSKSVSVGALMQFYNPMQEFCPLLRDKSKKLTTSG